MVVVVVAVAASLSTTDGAAQPGGCIGEVPEATAQVEARSGGARPPLLAGEQAVYGPNYTVVRAINCLLPDKGRGKLVHNCCIAIRANLTAISFLA